MSISINSLSSEIQNILQKNAGKITDKVKVLAEEKASKLAKNTKTDSPVHTGDFKRHISYIKTKETSTNAVYTWYVKDPEYRLTHLIAKGHKSRKGKEVKATFPLEQNVEKIEKDFIKGVEDIIKNEC